MGIFYLLCVYFSIKKSPAKGSGVNAPKIGMAAALTPVDSQRALIMMHGLKQHQVIKPIPKSSQ